MHSFSFAFVSAVKKLIGNYSAYQSFLFVYPNKMAVLECSGVFCINW